jgi:mono/diheme cytochrome c family protein
MRWTRWTALFATLAVAAAATISLSCEKAQLKAPSPTPQAEKLERGEYLATVTGCNDCHTPGSLYGKPDSERKLSGSELGWTGPWGTSYARNLTPDVETGIGTWSEDDIVKTIRTGQRADGSALLPPMPWPNYARLTDEDAYAIAAYLKNLPPVTHRVPDKLPPGKKATTPALVFGPPSAWDAPRPSSADTTKKTS